MDAILQWGISLVLALQNIGGLEGVMQFFTFLGSEEFFLLVLPLVYWCVDAAVGARGAVVLVASVALNGLLKLVFHLPRPYWIDRRVQAMASETSYGLPSGHAQNAAALWSFLAAQMKRQWAWAVALALIFFISLSRLYLGVHFLTDSLGGGTPNSGSWSEGTFTLSIPKGTLIRAVLPLSQAKPCYLAGFSRTVRT